LKAAVEAVDKAKTDHKLAVADGSTDPTLSAWYTHNSSNNNPFAINTIGVSVSIPLRIFDRNQGEKLRTQLDIARNERLRRWKNNRWRPFQNQERSQCLGPVTYRSTRLKFFPPAA